MLEAIWFALWGVLWAVYFMLDGFDLGLGTLMPVLGRRESERRAIYNSIGPFWDGNEVWLLTAGGVTFAAFPRAYGVMFSGLYSALMLILFALIIRGVSIGFREEVESSRAKAVCDWLVVFGSVLPALLFGVAFANIFRGIPIDGEGVYRGGLLTLINPYGLAGGALFLLLFLVHGALWLAVKTGGDLGKRAGCLAGVLWYPLLAVAVGFLVATWFVTRLYDNYLAYPLLLVFPLAAVVGLLWTKLFAARGVWLWAWVASSVTIFSVTLFGVIGLFPNLLPSSLDPAFSLTTYNSASSPLTLKIMLVVALTFVPAVIIYQTWAYMFFREKVSGEEALYGEG
ncbi:MAG: cytochrome d ubiquinol oxidase subunit II [Candidatus Abyssubacteria bacterium]